MQVQYTSDVYKQIRALVRQARREEAIIDWIKLSDTEATDLYEYFEAKPNKYDGELPATVAEWLADLKDEDVTIEVEETRIVGDSEVF
jgi:ATP-dependent protease HslVU (ClpYQ) peptidase subunit